MIVEYAIDANDQLISVGADWSTFAADNGAPELAQPPLGRSLWSFIRTGGADEVWHLLVTRARDADKPIELSCRCDAPETRRWFAMTLTASADRTLWFRSVLLRAEQRVPVPFRLMSLWQESSAHRSAPQVVVCGWCARWVGGGRWMEIEEYLSTTSLLERSELPTVAYGICPDCEDQLFSEVLLS